MADLRAVSRALRAAARAREASTALRMTASASFGFSSRNSASFALTTDSTKPCMPGLPSLVFVWPSNCGSVSLAEMTAGQTLADVLALERLVLLLEHALGARVAVDRARQRRAEAREVRAALVRVDVVREREDRLLVGAVPLHRDLDRAVLALALEEDDLLLDRVLVLVDVADEILDPALVVELLGLRALAALVGDRDAQAAGQERRLAQALLERGVLEARASRRPRRPGGSGSSCRSPSSSAPWTIGPCGRAADVGLLPLVAVALDGHVELVRERVDDRDADAVQAAGDLVAAALAELAAGVQDGEHDLEGGLVLLLHLRDRDAAAVVDDGHRVVGMDRHRDRVAVAGQRLVHRVVHNLIDKVVQPAHTGRADVHARTLADGLEALENRDVLGVIARLLLSVRWVAGAQGSLSSTQATPRRDGGRPRPGRGQSLATDISRSGFQIRTRARSKVPANVKNRGPTSARGCPPLTCGSRGSAAASRLAAERLVEPRDDELGHQVELVRADRAVARHGEHPVALGDRLGDAGERPDGGRPRPLDGREQRRRLERVRERVEREGDRPGALRLTPLRPRRGGGEPLGESFQRREASGRVVADLLAHDAVLDRDPRHVGLVRRPARARARSS